MSFEPYGGNANARNGGANDKFVQALSERVWALEEATNNIIQLSKVVGTPKDDSPLRGRLRQNDDTGFRLRNEIERILRTERDILMKKGRHTTDNTFRRLEQQSMEIVKKYVQASDAARRKVQNNPLPEDRRGPAGERVTANPVFAKRDALAADADFQEPFQFNAEKLANADIQVKEVCVRKVFVLKERSSHNAHIYHFSYRFCLLLPQENARNALMIAQTTTELHNVMRDFSENVEKQGESITQIEEAVTESLERVEVAVADVQKASQYQSQYRKKCVVLAFVFALIIIAVGVLVGLKYSGKL